MNTRGLTLALALLIAAGASAQEPYVPESDDAVVMTLRAAGSGAVDWDEPRRLREGLARNPDDARLRVTLARWYLDQGQRSGDARLYGHAAAALRPWRDNPVPPPDVALVRASLHQHEHRFEQALADLDIVIAARPRTPRAWLARAAILENLGRPREALRACAALRRMAPRAVYLTCAGSALGLAGNDARAVVLLESALAATDVDDRRLRPWILSRLAENQRRLGHAKRAVRLWREALALDPSDGYAMTRLADLLLARERYRDVLDLEAPGVEPTSLALRKGIAARALGDPDHARRSAALMATRDADRRRDGIRHLADEALLALDLEDRPAEALRLAADNWAVQRTPADARILVRAALASGRSQAAQPVLDWLARTGFRDPELEALIAHLDAKRPGT